MTSQFSIKSHPVETFAGIVLCRTVYNVHLITYSSSRKLGLVPSFNRLHVYVISIFFAKSLLFYFLDL